MKKAIIGIIIAVAVISGACYAFAESVANSSASGEVASTVGSAIYNDNTKHDAQADNISVNTTNSSNNTDVKNNNDTNSSKGSSNTENNSTKVSSGTTNSDSSKKTTDVSSSNNTTENQGSLSFDLQGKNSQSNVKATPLTSAQLSKFIGTWTFGQSIGYSAGGSAYGDDGILNLPGKQFTIKENSIDFCGQEYKISNYYMTKQSTAEESEYMLDKKENPNPLGIEDGYYTILTAVNTSESPSIANINNFSAPGIQLTFFVVGDKLVYDDVGALFEATKN